MASSNIFRQHYPLALFFIVATSLSTQLVTLATAHPLSFFLRLMGLDDDCVYVEEIRQRSLDQYTMDVAIGEHSPELGQIYDAKAQSLIPGADLWTVEEYNDCMLLKRRRHDKTHERSVVWFTNNTQKESSSNKRYINPAGALEFDFANGFIVGTAEPSGPSSLGFKIPIPGSPVSAIEPNFEFSWSKKTQKHSLRVEVGLAIRTGSTHLEVPGATSPTHFEAAKRFGTHVVVAASHGWDMKFTFLYESSSEEDVREMAMSLGVTFNVVPFFGITPRGTFEKRRSRANGDSGVTILYEGDLPLLSEWLLPKSKHTADIDSMSKLSVDAFETSFIDNIKSTIDDIFEMQHMYEPKNKEIMMLPLKYFDPLRRHCITYSDLA